MKDFPIKLEMALGSFISLGIEPKEIKKGFFKS